MLSDDEFENEISELYLINILKSRQDLVSTAELWAILKETCVALTALRDSVEMHKLKININCLMIDAFGNVQINIDRSSSCDTVNAISDKSMLINSIGETMMFIIVNYSNIDSSENIFQFVRQLLKTSPNGDCDIYKIELYADRQLNGSSIEILSNDFANFKKSEDISSAFQDSFLSSEYSLNTDPDSVSDQSLCLTKEEDTLSFKSECVSSPSDFGSCLLSLTQLWNHCYDLIISNDQECLVLLHTIFKKISNNLLNENNSKKCLCVSLDNILFDQRGKLFLNFSSDYCPQCFEGNPNSYVHDIKYINKIGNILCDVVQSDRRIQISSYILLMLQRMVESKDLIINDILNFCKSNISPIDIKSRSILLRLLERWKYWYTVHQNYLSNLKYKFLYDISTMDLRNCLKKVSTKSPATVYEIFQENISWLNGLKYVTKLSKYSFPLGKRTTYPYDIGKDRQFSAFQPYQSQHNTCNATIISGKPSRVKYNTHFRPLILTSECTSVYQSQDNLLSPIDVLPQYSIRSQCCSSNKTKLPNSSQIPIWQSVSHLPTDNTILSTNRMGLKHHLSLNRSNLSKSSSQQSLTTNKCSRPLKINTIIDIIQSLVAEHYDARDDSITDRHILTIADFALSLEALTENVFHEAIQQRFSHIQWSKQSLKLLFNAVNHRDTITKEYSGSLLAINEHDKVDGCSLKVHNNGSLSRQTLRSRNLSKNSFSLTNINCEYVSLNHERMSINNGNSLRNIPIVKPCMIAKSASVSNKRYKRGDIKTSLIRERTLSESDEIYVNDDQDIPSQKNLEDASFYEAIHCSTILCFSATASILSPDWNPLSYFSVNPSNIQDVTEKFFSINQSIKFKVKELTKTMRLIGKCGENNDKKLKKQCNNDRVELEQNLESLFLNQMKFESLVIEYHSIGMDPILEEVKTQCASQAIWFSNDVRNLRNLLMVQPYALVACLFAKGAVTSGLLYQFFLIYREFYTPLEFISVLSAVFVNFQGKFANQYRQIVNARLRLLFIITCWIDGFYKIDFTDLVYTKVVKIVKHNLVPYIKNCNELVENSLAKAKNETASPLLFKFLFLKDGNYSKMDLLQNIDIEKAIKSVEKDRNEKQKFHLWFSINFEKAPKISKREEIFSIVDFSPKDLAMCFTLMEQHLLNNIHPCHLLLYINSLSCTEESILQTITLHRFAINDISEHKEILSSLRHSGKITHWAMSEILRTTNFKSQRKIVKILIFICIWCVELNNYATAISILEAIHSHTLKWAPFWSHVKPKTLKILKELDDITNKFLRNTSNFAIEDKQLHNSFLTGKPFLPSLHALLVNLKLTLIGTSIMKDGCLKWSKLKQICGTLDKIRIYSLFKYTSNNPGINDSKQKLFARINHLTSISLDLLQSHNMLAQQA